MEDVLFGLRTYEVWIYLVIGLGVLVSIRKFILAWQELRNAVFGLEKENAQSRLNQAAGLLALLLIIAMTEFVAVSFVAPGEPGANPLLTPTLDLLASPTITMSVTALANEQTPSPPAPTPTFQVNGQGCQVGQLQITAPTDGSQIQGIVEIKGTVDISNYGFYKLIMKRLEERDWLTILAGEKVVQDAALGTWNTSLLSPGAYQLGLVVGDNQGNSLSPCVIQVNIVTAVGTQQP